MKKVIIFLLFTFLFIPFKNIKAGNGYDLPLGKDIKINSVNEKYKWYKLKEVDSRKENVFEHSCEYLELKETDFTEWSTVKPEEKYGRIIEEKEVSPDHQEVNKYSKIIISNIYSPSLHIKEIILYDENSNEIKYSYATCGNCFNAGDVKYIYDRNYSTTFEIKYNSTIHILLDEEISSNIRVQIFFEHDDVIYGFRVSAVDKRTNEVFYQKDETLNTLVRIYSPAYDSYRNSKTLSWFKDNATKYYRYKDSYLVCHEKEYLSDYYESMDDYIKDENGFIKYYDYEEIKPSVVEKEVFKEIIVPKEKVITKEKIVNKYIVASKEINDQQEEISNSEQESCKYVIKNEIKENKDVNDKKTNIKIYVVFVLFLSLIVVLCLFLKELIKRCR